VAALVFVIGVALTALAFVLDQALIGLLRGGLQLNRNVVFSVVKLAALIPVAALIADAGPQWIYGTWTVGIAISLVVLVRFYRSREGDPLGPDFRLLREMRVHAVTHHAVNLALRDNLSRARHRGEVARDRQHLVAFWRRLGEPQWNRVDARGEVRDQLGHPPTRQPRRFGEHVVGKLVDGVDERRPLSKARTGHLSKRWTTGCGGHASGLVEEAAQHGGRRGAQFLDADGKLTVELK